MSIVGCPAVYYFKHNDVADLERVLRGVVEAGRGRPLTRRFIVTEGVSHTRGSVAPLRAMHALKQKYKFRMIVDETLSFGVCGPRGRGACEAAGLAPEDVEIITGAPAARLLACMQRPLAAASAPHAGVLHRHRPFRAALAVVQTPAGHLSAARSAAG